MIREMLSDDAAEILRIYQIGLDQGNASFETQAPDWQQWDIKHHALCRLAFELDGLIVGWAALAPTSARDCYRGVAELSIYIDPDYQGRGIGSQLMSAIINCSEQHDFWTLTASVFPENGATLALHQKHGFRQIGRRERIAQHHDRWRDTLLLERRSTNIGTT